MRDRDAAGRPRNDRPRDGLGRPLARGARAEAVGRVPDDLVLPPAESLAEAQRLLDDGRPFHAHEILEGTWKAAPAGERDLWQGLAQLAVGLTHLARGNPRGAVTLLRRGAARLAPYRADPPHDVAVDALVRWAETRAADVEAVLGADLRGDLRGDLPAGPGPGADTSPEPLPRLRAAAPKGGVSG